jgi:hypothetical protein
MNPTTDFERTLAAWLEHGGPDDVPMGVVEAAITDARTVRQRPALLTSTWWTSLEDGTMKATETVGRVPTIAVTRPPLRLGWVAVALAALLALLGGLLLIGAVQERPPLAVSACPPGTTPDEPGPIDQARPTSVEAVVWDPADGRSVLAFSPADARTGATWRFDVCSNTWRQFSAGPTPVTVPGPTGVGLVPDLGDAVIVNDADSGSIIVVERGRSYVWSYDADADRWALVGERPFDSFVTAARDPVTGLIVVFGATMTPDSASEGDVIAGQMWTLDIDTGSWTSVGDGAPRLDQLELLAGSLAYDQAADRFVLVVPPVDRAVVDAEGQPLPAEPPLPGGTWLFDLRSRTWSARTAPPPESLILETGWGWGWGFETRSDPTVYDEANGRLLAFGTQTVAAFDATTATWEEVWSGDASIGRMQAPKAFDPRNGRVMTFVRLIHEGVPASVAAFDLAARDWIVLDRVELQLE